MFQSKRLAHIFKIWRQFLRNIGPSLPHYTAYVQQEGTFEVIRLHRSQMLIRTKQSKWKSKFRSKFVFTCTSTFLGAFIKLRKATLSSVMSVCPSVRPSARNKSTHTGRIFMTFHFWVFMENDSRKFKFH